MGRRDAVQVIVEVVAECRRLLPSLIVSYEPNWERRGNGTSANYDFGTVHHTASASSLDRPFPTENILRDGRSDLPGPLCNFAGPACTPEAPRLHVMSANPANHAGASRASGPVPALSLFNPRTLGIEIDYAGTVPMLAGQLLVGHVWTKAVANVLAGGNVQAVRAHFETSVTGKWDPGWGNGQSYNMADWRALAAAKTPPAPYNPPPPPPPLEDEDDMPQLITTYVKAGDEVVLPLGPVQGGAAHWGRAWVAVIADCFGAPRRAIPVRAGYMDDKGGYTPLTGSWDFAMEPGTRFARELPAGAVALVVSATDPEYGVGISVEYAKA